MKDLDDKSNCYQIIDGSLVTTHPPNLHIRHPSSSLPESMVPSMENTMTGKEIQAACEEKFPETAMKDIALSRN